VTVAVDWICLEISPYNSVQSWSEFALALYALCGVRYLGLKLGADVRLHDAEDMSGYNRRHWRNAPFEEIILYKNLGRESQELDHTDLIDTSGNRQPWQCKARLLRVKRYGRSAGRCEALFTWCWRCSTEA
jgi:hypothetical protein